MNELERRLYLALHTGKPGDIDHYRQVCEGVESVLELGVGDARVLASLDVARRVGIDRDPGMIELAQARLPTARLEVGDMASFALGEGFDRILIPASSLFALPDREAMRRCLQCAEQHLNPAGAIWFDAYGSDAFHRHSEPETDEHGRVAMELIAEIEIDGSDVAVFEANRWNRDEQRFDVVYWFELGRGVVEQWITHHYLLSSQVHELAESAGLRVVSLWKDFGGEAFVEDSTHMVGCLERT